MWGAGQTLDTWGGRKACAARFGRGTGMLTGAEGREEVAGGALVVKGGSLDGAGVGLSLEPRRSQSLVEGWAMSVRRGEVFHRHCSLGHRWEVDH